MDKQFILKVLLDGSVVQVEVEKEKDLGSILREVIGGYMETVPASFLSDKYIMIVNEDGYDLGLGLNLVATQIFNFKEDGLSCAKPYCIQPILGTTCLVKVGMTPAGLDMVPLNEKDVKEIVNKLEEFI